MAATLQEIGESALRELNLPSGSRLHDPAQATLSAYWIIAQVLNAFRRRKDLSKYLSEKLPVAYQTLKAAWDDIPDSQPTPGTRLDWIKALQGCRAIVATRRPDPPGHAILRYLRQVAELTDMAALEKMAQDAYVELDLNTLGSVAPTRQNLDAESALLVFATPRPNRKGEQSGAKWRTFLRVRIELPDGESTYRPIAAPDLTAARLTFFDAEGDPRGDFTVASLQETIGAPWSKDALSTWLAFITEIDQRCSRLCGVGLKDLPVTLFGNSAPNMRVLLVDRDKVPPSALLNIFDGLINQSRQIPLLDKVLAGPAGVTPVSLRSARRDLFLGHMDERDDEIGRRGFPLDPTQRLAAMTAAALDPAASAAPLLPVNGPPGTGKTSFLRAILASSWVKAAYEKAVSPPIVVGTGATNKAVSNIIEAFSTVAAVGGTGIEARWLDGLPSYGWLYPSRDAAERFPSLMHLVYRDKNPFAFGGGANEFIERGIDAHASGYVVRAMHALKLDDTKQWEVADIVAALHCRIVDQVVALRREQRSFRELLEAARSALGPARRTAYPQVAHGRHLAGRVANRERLESDVRLVAIALDRGRKCHQVQYSLESGIKGFMRNLFGDWPFKREMQDLRALQATAMQAALAAGMEWTLLGVDQAPRLEAMDQHRRRLEGAFADNQSKIGATERALANIRVVRAQRRTLVSALLDQMHVPTMLPPRERTNIKYLLQFCRATTEEGRARAEDMLWHRFDARQVLQHRFTLFHLAARYWEGRWLLENLGQGGCADTDQARLQRLMMLGVIIVSTTHKLPSIGERSPIDLLVVDESGQCAPEVGAASLSFARSALLVGDAKQLQPVSMISQEQSLQIARLLDIDLPVEFCAARGSAMAIALRAAPVTDSVDGNGVTLLYHYRCHPAIIGYCNSLLYDGKIRCVRRDVATRAGMPPMSWVDVPGTPERAGASSWKNEDELAEVARWLGANAQRLTDAYRKPLHEVVAVITPLRGQADLAKEYLIQALADVIPSGEMEAMTIGTVHSLQGAERPVVAFSLVQHRANGNLFADRDGGFLMNVAVSRAKDAFVVFGDRRSLLPAPTDKRPDKAESLLPVSRLGAYLRENGTRLYPRRLVVVEAPGKVQRIGEALGIECAVIATRGNLLESTLEPDGTLNWSPAPQEFIASMATHRHLLDELIIATDDDLAGELIGMQVADVAASALGDTVPVRRMRFHAVEVTHLRDALSAAGPRFDSDYLAAALLRDVLRHLDMAEFRAALPRETYHSIQERALVALVDTQHAEDLYLVEAWLVDMTTREVFWGYVPQSTAVHSAPAAMARKDAVALAANITGEGGFVTDVGTILRVPPLYPASTTQRILAAAADSLNILPWEAQEHLNAMYQEGVARS